MDGRVEDKVSENVEGKEQELGNDVRIQMTSVRWLGRSRKEKVGLGGDEGGINWGYGPVPSRGKRDIDKRGIGSNSGRGDDMSDRLDDNGGRWKGEELAHYLQSTRIRVIEGLVPLWAQEGRKRLRYSRRMWFGWRGR